MFPRSLPAVLSLVACAAHRPIASSPRPSEAPAARPPAASAGVARLVPEGALRAPVARARCRAEGLALVGPPRGFEALCPWGAPDCEVTAPFVLRNCGREAVKALTIQAREESEGRRVEYNQDGDFVGSIEPNTERTLMIPIAAGLASVSVRVEVAGRGREPLHAVAAIVRATVVPAGSGGAFGPSTRLRVLDAAADGRWVVTCQALTRDADAPRTLLLREGAPAVAYDTFLRAAPAGRFVVFARDRRAVLRDTLRDVDAPLDVGDMPLGDAEFTFDARGRRLSYLRRSGGRRLAVVRTLATGAEAVVDPDADDLWYARLDPDGDRIRLRRFTHAPDGQRRLVYRVTWIHDHPTPCRLHRSPYPEFDRGPVEVHELGALDGPDAPVPEAPAVLSLNRPILSGQGVVLAVASDGRALIPASNEPRGPLRWVPSVR